jgi:hypothetical protein
MRRIHRLSGLFFVALLLLSLPAQACGLVMREAVAGELSVYGVGVDDAWKCSTPPLSLPAFNFNRMVTSFASPDAVDGSDRQWASSSEYRWKADVNRAMDHVFKPPSGVNLFVTQTREEVRDGFEHNYKPNSTLGAIELEIQW